VSGLVRLQAGYVYEAGIPKHEPNGDDVPDTEDAPAPPDDAAAAASAEIFAAMDGSTLAEAEADEAGDGEAGEGETPAE
jgi:hypothetical protein